MSFLHAEEASAVVTITEFSLTPDSVEFTISGELPSEIPNVSRDKLYFTNSDFFNDPGFVLPGSFIGPDSFVWTGIQTLDVSFPLFSVATNAWDAFGFNFANDLTPGETVAGKLTANFPSNTFDPLEIERIDLFWGAGMPSTVAVSGIPGGVLVDSFAVPEPTPTILIGIVAILSVLPRKRDKRR